MSILDKNKKNKKNKKEILCEKCGKIFNNKKFYNFHKCEIGFICTCEKIFKSKMDLIQHNIYCGKINNENEINLNVTITEKCCHEWIYLKDRVHNKGDGKGKYMAYKCTKCNTFQKRYLK